MRSQQAVYGPSVEEGATLEVTNCLADSIAAFDSTLRCYEH